MEEILHKLIQWINSLSKLFTEYYTSQVVQDFLCTSTVCIYQYRPYSTPDGSEIPNNHLGCIKPCK